MRNFKVTNEDSLYFDHVGEALAVTLTTVILDLDCEDVIFNKDEVTEVI